MKTSSIWLLGALSGAITCGGMLSGWGETKSAPGEQLKFVLVLSRHGVRSPTWTNARLDEYAKEPWPQWSVAPGLLTPHGKTLMTLFGSYYRVAFAERGLLSANGCADAGSVFIYADTDERTMETGRGIADGMLPHCTVEVHSAGDGVQDALFHTAGKIGKPDPELALQALAGRIGNAPAALLPAYRMQLEAMQTVLSGCAEPGCALAGKKSLLDTSSSLTEGTGEHLAELKGPLTTGATFAENFQLEYLDGMPDAEVGWGRVSSEKMLALMAVHAASSDLVQRTPYIARVQGSNLVLHILDTLEQAEERKPITGALGSAGDKVVFLIGHDTNIANVAALLNAHWLVDGYQRDDAAPGGALVFELWSGVGNRDTVRISYLVQTPEQMRKTLPLSLAAPPTNAPIFVPGCGQIGDGAPCAWVDFEHLVQTVTDPAFSR